MSTLYASNHTTNYKPIVSAFCTAITPAIDRAIKSTNGSTFDKTVFSTIGAADLYTNNTAIGATVCSTNDTAIGESDYAADRTTF